MKRKINIEFIIVITAFTVIVFLISKQMCNGPVHVPLKKTVYDTIYNNVLYRDTFTKFIYKTKYVPIPLNVDTQKILKDYYSNRNYDDTLKNDTDAFIRITENISQNKIKDRKLFFINRRPTAIIKTTRIISNKNKIYAGFYVNYVNSVPDGGLSLSFSSPKKLYEVSYSPFSKTFTAGVQFNLYSFGNKK